MDATEDVDQLIATKCGFTLVFERSIGGRSVHSAENRLHSSNRSAVIV